MNVKIVNGLYDTPIALCHGLSITHSPTHPYASGWLLHARLCQAPLGAISGSMSCPRTLQTWTIRAGLGAANPSVINSHPAVPTEPAVLYSVYTNRQQQQLSTEELSLLKVLLRFIKATKINLTQQWICTASAALPPVSECIGGQLVKICHNTV